MWGYISTLEVAPYERGRAELRGRTNTAADIGAAGGAMRRRDPM